MKQLKTALICEDNVTTAFCIKQMLERIGYQTDIANTAAETSKKLGEKRYDLMTLDILLPDKHGLILLKEIKSEEKTKDLPIIVLSAIEKKDLEMKDFPDVDIETEVIYWVQKSFDRDSIEQEITSVLKSNDKQEKAKVLHLEDDEDLLNLIDILLSDIADTTKAKTLSEAEKALKENVFDAIILDYKLPEGTCEKIINDVKSTQNKNAKLILFSAYEPSKELSAKVDKVMLKTTVSHQEFLNCVKFLIK